MKETLESETTFLGKDATIIHPHNKELVIIIVRCDDW